jgi:hypothetical protein
MYIRSHRQKHAGTVKDAGILRFATSWMQIVLTFSILPFGPAADPQISKSSP